MTVLLERFDFGSNSEHKNGQKPVFLSASSGHDRVMIV